MSRRSKRTVAVLTKYMMESEESNSENESDNFQVHAALKKNTKRTNKKSVTTKKIQAPKRTVAKRTVPEIINLDIDSDSRENDVSEALKYNHRENIQSKVDSFFKSSNLFSDDDDEPPTKKSQTVKESTFYEIPDSDDERPSTSVSKTTTSYSWSTSNVEVCKPANGNKEEELMEIVDKILESNDTSVETNSEPESYTEFKSRTEEILDSVKALLGSLEGIKQNKTVDPVAEEKPKEKEKDKLSCPICLEILADKVIPGATVCGHIFCMECIKQVVRTLKSCPTCRKKITMKQIHPLYL